MKYHTIIAGAGPAGLACARVLGEAGKKVLIVEEKSVVGQKICAGGITWSGISRFLPPDLIEKSFPIQHLRTPRQRITLCSPFPLVSTVNRKKLGAWMLQQALEAGAEMVTARVSGFSGNSVETSSGTFEGDYVVGADGSSSTIRRLSGIPREKYGIGINYSVPGDFKNMEWHLDYNLFGNGYAWIFPHRECASIGVFAGHLSIKADRLKKNFHLWCKNRGINLDGLRLTAALINYDYRGWRFGNLFLAGDAAGLASPLTGEGIYPGIISGEEIAKTILNRNHDQSVMQRLLKRHRFHLGMVEFTARSRLLCNLTTELAALALRSGVLPFNKIEMTG
ncbi:MAG: NAD(P)/FAD-dependent oxidoreductase [Proteobacteria bacterium]|nr:NAD(P)/FAD-dependent oxidoreductase [Pseudomonadota bacterium]MBU1736597.1 NAD(P)/FAD-dependent oxidoreductase [Pseudomonadota bacterium]